MRNITFLEKKTQQSQVKKKDDRKDINCKGNLLEKFQFVICATQHFERKKHLKTRIKKKDDTKDANPKETQKEICNFSYAQYNILSEKTSRDPNSKKKMTERR